jgi:DNA-directed RNA polymerase subunit RPC12/RpoP
MDGALIPIVVIPLALIAQLGFASRFDWQCGNCGNTFHLSPLTATLMPHSFGGRKLAKCPNCGVRSWVSPVRKQT